ncbi:hypothetical protein RI129_003195 [Pyrocoelia pectoralis]|uniref:THAP-type domain-containing protein n=1 Tax=Pyrocoelia pectoralis TaxID=417401 RepID=A0AAN7VPX3_9COLE
MNKSRRKRICFLCDSKSSQSYHKFPTKQSLRSLWLQACNLTPNDNVNSLTICSRHFMEHDFVDLNAKKFGGTIRLQSNAVPSLSVRCNRNAALHISGPSKQLNVPFTTVGNNTSNPSNKITVQSPTPSLPQKITFKSGNCRNLYKYCMFIEIITATVEEYVIEEVLCKEEQHPMETEMSTPGTQKRLITPRYVGDLSDIDVCTPSRAKRAVEIAKETVTRHRRQIKRLQQQNRRLHVKVKCLKDKLYSLKKKK